MCCTCLQPPDSSGHWRTTKQFFFCMWLAKRRQNSLIHRAALRTTGAGVSGMLYRLSQVTLNPIWIIWKNTFNTENNLSIRLICDLNMNTLCMYCMVILMAIHYMHTEMQQHTQVPTIPTQIYAHSALHKQALVHIANRN